MNNKIDIIIPIYNISEKELFQCLSSLSYQSIINLLNIIIIDDNSSNQYDYKKIIDIFIDFLNIKYIKNNMNKGYNESSQIGIDNSYNDFIIFLNSNDTFISPYSLQILIKPLLENDNYKISESGFKEVIKNNDNIKMINHSLEEENEYIYGKIYRRNFIQNNNIKFNQNSIFDGDKYFNNLFNLFIKKDSEICRINYLAYYHNSNLSSINKLKNQNIFEKIKNIIYTIQTAYINNGNYVKIKQFIVYNMIILYYDYILSNKSQEILNQSKEYYKNIYQYIKNDPDKDYFIQKYFNEISKKILQTENYIINFDITFQNFLNLLK